MNSRVTFDLLALAFFSDTGGGIADGSPSAVITSVKGHTRSGTPTVTENFETRAGGRVAMVSGRGVDIGAHHAYFLIALIKIAEQDVAQ